MGAGSTIFLRSERPTPDRALTLNFMPLKGMRSWTCMPPCWKLFPGAKWKLPATLFTCATPPRPQAPRPQVQNECKESGQLKSLHMPMCEEERVPTSLTRSQTALQPRLHCNL